VKTIRAFAGVLVIQLVLSSLLTAAGPSVDRNVVFGTYSGLALLMDVHRPTAPNGYGIVVVNGSAWHRPLGYDAPHLKDSGELMPIVQRLNAAGYTAFVVNHRAAPRFHAQDAIDDAQRAVRFVRANAKLYGIRADRIGALGASSGGHLVSMLGTLDGAGEPDATDPVDRQSSKVQAVVAFYPVVDLLSATNTRNGLAVITALTGMRPPRPNAPASSPDVKLYRQASPMTYVTPDDPPFLLIHGEADTTVSIEQSAMMEVALRKATVPVKFVRVPGAEHGMQDNDAAWKSVDSAGLTLEWFERHLRQVNPTQAAK
jgi:acetyl esterase/lipase